jgi:hypothetical protein
LCSWLFGAGRSASASANARRMRLTMVQATSAASSGISQAVQAGSGQPSAT